MAKFSKASQQSVESAMKRMKQGKLKSGSGDNVENPKQAIAIGLSEARKKGAKVPVKKSAGKSATGKPGSDPEKPVAEKAATKKASSGKADTKPAVQKKGAPGKPGPKKASSK